MAWCETSHDLRATRRGSALRAFGSRQVARSAQGGGAESRQGRGHLQPRNYCNRPELHCFDRGGGAGIGRAGNNQDAVRNAVDMVVLARPLETGCLSSLLPWRTHSPPRRLCRELRTLAAAIKPRWICEEAHQQMKEELGLDHFEGRSWQGLHRHALMTMCQFSFCTLPGSSGVMIPKTFLKLCPATMYHLWNFSLACQDPSLLAAREACASAPHGLRSLARVK